MTGPAVDFEAADLAKQIETLTQAQLNELPFGVVLIDNAGFVRFYSDTEARLSGFNKSAVGLNFYDICDRFGRAEFRGRIAEAAAQGAVDLEFGWTGDYADPKRDLRIRVQSARAGGVWICIERD